MLAVSDTSPLLNLAIVGRLALLRQQLGEVWIPPAVLDELRVESDRPGSQQLCQAVREGWLRVEQLEDQSVAQMLRRELDWGEAEAIALALQSQAAWTLLDEREGRRIAKSLGLRVTGILGVLLRARREGQLSSVQSAMEELREKAGFRIGAELFAALVAKGG